MNKPKYKTWIRTKPIIIFSILTAVSLLLLLFSFVSILFLIFIIPTFIFGYILLIIGVSSLRFSKIGGDYQNKMRISLSEIMELPFPLKHKKVLGYAELITGRIVDKD